MIMGFFSAEQNAAKSLQKQRLLRDRTNPMDVLDDEQIRQRYRFDRAGIERKRLKLQEQCAEQLLTALIA